MPAAMTSILDRNPDQHARPASWRKLNNPRFLAAALLLAGIAAGFCSSVVYLETHAKANPLVILCFPFLGVTCIFLAVPLAFFLSFEDEFKRINPLNPAHFAFLVKKTYQSLANNQWKLAAKDL